jgi:isoleucyl-tRNA synthetase
MGRADGVLRAQGNRRAASAHARAARGSREARRAVGIEAWQSLDPRELIGDDANLYEKNRDTLDVWFDSGTTHWHVLRGSHKDQLQFPADLYLEGSDQHRGWFHSSLLTASMIDGRAPYKALLTHGFTVDGEGRKMSKSLGNGIDPHEVANRLGAEIIRLWIASTDYSGELAISEEILKRVTEGYRRIRNTLRFLLANLSDFDFAQHAVPVDEWLEIDRYAVAFSAQLQTELLGHYEKYEFHPVVAKLQTYCSEDLGGFYLDVLKDRLYTSAADSRARRSAQTALYHLTQGLLRVLAPFLSFTAEEAWKVFQPASDTVFTETYYAYPEVAGAAALIEKWALLRDVRGNVTKALEEARTANRIGSSLQAEVAVHASGARYDALTSLGDDLRFVLITSAASVVKVDDEAHESVDVAASKYQKCERCWHYREDVGAHAEHPTLCGRCFSNLFENGEIRALRNHGENPVETGQRRARALARHFADRDPVRPAVEDRDPENVRVRRAACADVVLQSRAGVQPRRRVRLPVDRERLAALGVHRARHRRDAGDLLPVAPARPAAAVQPVARADPRRRARQRDRPAAVRPRDRLSRFPSRRLAFRRSTSPIPRSRSARCC